MRCCNNPELLPFRLRVYHGMVVHNIPSLNNKVTKQATVQYRHDCSCTGIQDAPDEENGARLNVANQEDEGAVYGDFHRRFGWSC
jgi:hypothetical protein